MSEKTTSVGNAFRTFGIPISVLILAGSSLVVFRMLYFGYPFPNTVYEKFHGQLPSLSHVLQWGLLILPFLSASVAAILLLRDHRRLWVIRAAFALVLLQMVMVLPVHPVMYLLHRYQVALLPLAVLSIPVVVDLIHKRRAWLGVTLVAVLIGWSAQGWPQVREFHQSNELAILEQKRLTEAIMSLPGRPKLAMVEAGRVPYWTDLPAFDCGGLCERRPEHGGFSPEAALGSNAEIFVISIREMADGRFFPVLSEDQTIWASPLFRETYSLWRVCQREPEAIAANWMYDYAIFLRTDWALEKGFIDQRTDDLLGP